jgi:hypothetical protein
MTRTRGTLAAAALALGCSAAGAQELPPQFGRYMPLYPGLYLGAGVATDERHRSFGQSGHEVAGATPQTPGRTRFPETTAVSSFTWHFPMFESSRVPFFSSRTHLAQLTFRWTETSARGALAAFAADASDDAYSEADRLENNGAGVGDVTAQFGSFLVGSPAKTWRTRRRTPFALLALAGVTLPFGEYNRDAPVNAGANTASAQGTLGLHWQPWPGGFVDAGYGRREFFRNYDPQFGALAPAEQGDEVYWDASFAQRLGRDWYFSVFFFDREGDPNAYRDPRFAPNQSSPPNATTSNDPTPGTYRDGGTKLNARGVALHYFVTQRWLAGLSYTHPQYGRSGQFLLPYTEHSPAGCVDGSTGCNAAAGEVILVDGLGPARTYSSNRLTLTLTYNFGLGDTYSCPGCRP